MIKFSKFDSKLLNLRVGKLTLRIRSGRDAKNMQRLLKNTNYDLVLIAMEDDNCLAINSLIGQGAHLSQIKVELSLRLRKLIYLHKFDVKSYSVSLNDHKPEDKLYLKNLAAELSKNSRFSCKIFSRGISKRLYEKWLENSLNKKVSNRNYFLKDNKKDRIVGMTTVKVNGNKSEIGLMIIHPRYRGRGLGKYLLREVLRDLSKNHIVSLSLKTELANLRALNFYGSFGFELKRSLFLLEFFKKEGEI